MSFPAERLYTLEEYFDLAERSDLRQEYFGGRIFAMAGGSPEHSRVAVNLAGELRVAPRRHLPGVQRGHAGLPCVGVEVPLAEICLDVPFPGEPGHSGSR